MASALSQTQLSNQKADHILVPFPSHLGHDVKWLIINPITIQWECIALQTALATELRLKFSPIVPLTFCWDMKLISNLSSQERINHLPILVSGEGVVGILAIPKLTDRKTEQIVTIITEILDQWNIKD